MKKGEMLSIAIQIAVEAHQGQFDRGGNPYILHPLHVMGALSGEDEEVQCAAVLHDVIEDNKKFTYQYLRERGLTERVIMLVRNVTKVPGETDEEYEARVCSDAGSMMIKREDLDHNSQLSRLKGVTEKDCARAVKYMMFYHKIANLQKDASNGISR